MQIPLLSTSDGPLTSACHSTNRSEVLAQLATFALVEEARLTPKPGLVDERGSGSHTDMDLTTLLRSAHCLEPMFAAIAVAASERSPSVELRDELAQIGREGEARMLAVTGGVNTHRGAIWTLGLLVGAAAVGHATSGELAGRAGRLAQFPRSDLPNPVSHGVEVARRYGFPGARGEAREGFPHVWKLGLPVLHASRARKTPEPQARLNALLAIMAELNDTCLVHRGGLAALAFTKAGARRVLARGGAGSLGGDTALLKLDDELTRRGLSPGGSADLFAAVLFLDAVDRMDGPKLSWKN